MIFVTGLIMVLIAFWGNKALPEDVSGFCALGGLCLMGLSVLILLSRVMP